MMKKFSVLKVVTVILIGGLLATAAFAGTVNISLGPTFTNISRPVLATHAKDASGRIFIVQQPGVIKVIQPGQTAATDFMDITSKVTLIGGIGDERGLLGLTFHPQFSTNSYFFVNYTRRGDNATVIERYKAINGNTVGDPLSGVPIISISQDFSNHNGGMIEFGPDGNLYIGMGDGGSGNDPNNRAQNINSLLGKFLRITPSLSDVVGGAPYTNPPDNPYVGIAGADEIYAIGMRNPYRWSFDRGGTNQLYAGDVGQSAFEEFDIITKGGNYGWRVYEGNQCTNNDPTLCTPTNYIPPVFAYARTGGQCSVIGGYVYRGTRGTFPYGAYVFGDYCSGQIWMWNQGTRTLLLNSGRAISGFGEDETGEIYVNGISGTVERLVNSTPLVNNSNADFDGDGKSDLSVYRPSSGVWYSYNSSNNTVSIAQFGLSSDIPTPEDFDGDNRTDLAVFRPSNGTWYIFRSGDNTVNIAQFGLDGDIPAAADYDADNKADLTIFRPSNGVWYILRSSNLQAQIVQFGSNGDVPVAADYDGDGKADISVWRPGSGIWYRLNSLNGGFNSNQFGQLGDIPTPGDFDGDGRAERATFRPSGGTWQIFRKSDGATVIFPWGADGDIPVSGDYDGDGREDAAVFRPSNGVWYIIQSSNNTNKIAQFGANGDVPSPATDRP